MSVDIKRLENYFKESFNEYIIHIEHVDENLFTLVFEGLKSKDYEYFDMYLAVSSFGDYELKIGFGIIEKTLRNYELINQFNDRSPFKAFIDSSDLMPELFICINETDLLDEEEVLKLFNIHFEQILSGDEIQKYLIPITDNTIRPD